MKKLEKKERDYSRKSLFADKLWLGRVFKFGSGCLPAVQFCYFETKLPSLKLKNWNERLLGSIPLDVALPAIFYLDLYISSPIILRGSHGLLSLSLSHTHSHIYMCVCVCTCVCVCC